MDYPKYRSIFNRTVEWNGVQFINNIFPENIPLDGKIMDLSHCHLTRLSLILELKNLRFLDISFNDLKVMDWHIHKLTALRQLVMRNNILSYLHEQCFQWNVVFRNAPSFKQPTLLNRTPYLWQTKLSQEAKPGGKPPAFSVFPVVRQHAQSRLALSNNLIGRLQANVFEMLSGLCTMKLDGNRISRIESISFNGLLQLWILYLTDNLLQTIPTQA